MTGTFTVYDLVFPAGLSLAHSSLGPGCSVIELRERNYYVKSAAHLADLLIGRPRLHEVFGQKTPPYPPYDEETETDVAVKGGGFTAHDLAMRRKRDHPKLRKAVTGTPYETPYRKQFGD
jgi:hypothetical protein